MVSLVSNYIIYAQRPSYTSRSLADDTSWIQQRGSVVTPGSATLTASACKQNDVPLQVFFKAICGFLNTRT